MSSPLKRKAPSAKDTPRAKKPRAEVPEYHLTPSKRDSSGEVIWPAPNEQIEAARAFIRECAKADQKTLIVPDKDADGLTSGVILYRTLILLGLPPSKITIHLLQKGSNPHTESERQAMSTDFPSYVFVLDQGSRKAPPIIDTEHKALIIDHHFAEAGGFPSGAIYVNACDSPPVATSSLLTFLICKPLHPDVAEQTDWLCAMGTHGDLGNTLKWAPPFPDMSMTFKRYTKKSVNDAVSLINAPRRTATYDVISAWEALLAAKTPSDVLENKRLLSARAEVNMEVEKWARTAPKFSKDATIAVFRIHSAAQIHPVIATRWAGALQSKKLEIVLVANEGYLPGMVNFSCRIPRCARGRDPPVNIIESLKDIASRAPDETLRARLGESFARGHKEASGGIVGKEEFEELMAILKVGEKPDKTGEEEVNGTKKGKNGSPQKNTLMNYFGKKD